MCIKTSNTTPQIIIFFFIDFVYDIYTPSVSFTSKPACSSLANPYPVAHLSSYTPPLHYNTSHRSTTTQVTAPLQHKSPLHYNVLNNGIPAYQHAPAIRQNTRPIFGLVDGCHHSAQQCNTTEVSPLQHLLTLLLEVLQKLKDPYSALWSTNLGTTPKATKFHSKNSPV